MLKTSSTAVKALGGTIDLTIVCEEIFDSTSLLKMLVSRVLQFEKQFSRFLPGSELTKFNRSAGLKCAISEEFAEILNAAQANSTSSGYIYNPFILPALQRAGYDHSMFNGHENDVVDNYINRTVVEIDKLEFGNGWARIPYGTAIDLGGIGKGFLADRLSRLLPDAITGYWFNMDGDLLFGGFDEYGKTWQADVESAFLPNSIIGTTAISSQKWAIATSATSVRTLKSKINDAEGHHIIDPKTGISAETDIIYATVVSESAEYADIFATCLVIIGSNEFNNFCLTHPQISSALIQFRSKDKLNSTLIFGNEIEIFNERR